MFNINVRNKLIEKNRYDYIKNYLSDIEDYAFSTSLDEKEERDKKEKLAKNAAKKINEICKEEQLDNFYQGDWEAFNIECADYCYECIKKVR